MGVLHRALGALGLSPAPEAPAKTGNPDYAQLMQEALVRIRTAELQIKEATTLEDLDLGRSALMSGWAEVQQLVRAAKRERGITVRPISETEEFHRNMRALLNQRTDPNRKRTGTTGTGR